MKEHPILFSAPMIQALLAGRKSVTRRMSKQWLKVKAGDQLWVRETWAPFDFSYEDTKPSELPHYAQIVYLADQKQKLSGDRYRPSIFMPRWASRIQLEALEDAREVRLHDMDEAEAMREGILRQSIPDLTGFRYHWGDSTQDRCGTAVSAFRKLWSTLHTKPGERWEDDPALVRVGEFRRIK